MEEILSRHDASTSTSTRAWELSPSQSHSIVVDGDLVQARNIVAILEAGIRGGVCNSIHGAPCKTDGLLLVERGRTRSFRHDDPCT